MTQFVDKRNPISTCQLEVSTVALHVLTAKVVSLHVELKQQKSEGHKRQMKALSEITGFADQEMKPNAFF